MRRICTWVASCIVIMTWKAAVAQAPLLESGTARRFAVIVGANKGAMGRSPLRHSHHDAQALGKVLVDVGGLRSDDVKVLLDPEPQVVLDSLDVALSSARSAGGESLVVFYYSGHADDEALYPNGKPLALRQIRSSLDDERATIRLGILDACRGGAWTRTKGFSEVEPFAVVEPQGLSSEGAVLIASSSGHENAHESDRLGGSFFTHHLVAGLRGAADRSGDGRVSLTEAFAFAQQGTIRDTAMISGSPQHPSFEMRLRGRNDVVLTQLDDASSVLHVDQSQGPLQLVQLDTGLIVVELPEGPRKARLALAPGGYVVRRRSGDRIVAAREITVESGKTVSIEEANLEVVGTQKLGSKGTNEWLVSEHTSLPRRVTELRASFGVSYNPGPSNTGIEFKSSDWIGNFQYAVGITDRLMLSGLALAYRFGDAGHREWLVSAGVRNFGFGFSSVESFIVNGTLGVGVDMRQWLSPTTSLWAGVNAQSYGYFSGLRTRTFDNLTMGASLGVSHTFGEVVTVNLGASVDYTPILGAGLVGYLDPPGSTGPTVVIGSALAPAGRALPLIQLHLSKHWSITGDVKLGFDLKNGKTWQSYTIGVLTTFP